METPNKKQNASKELESSWEGHQFRLTSRVLWAIGAIKPLCANCNWMENNPIKKKVAYSSVHCITDQHQT